MKDAAQLQAALKAAIAMHRAADNAGYARLLEEGGGGPAAEAAHRFQQAVLRAAEIALGAGADPITLCRMVSGNGFALMGFTAAAVDADTGVAWNDMIFNVRHGWEVGCAAGAGEAKKGNIPQGRAN